MKQAAASVQRWLHWTFEIGVLLKGISAASELLLGFLLLFVNVRGLVEAFARDELIDDPNDFVATHLSAAVKSLTPGVELYAALYLLAHGIVKVVLVWGLLKKQMWAYPASIVVLCFFIIYQVIKYAETRSVALLILTVFDTLLIFLILHEYRYIREKWRLQ